MNKVLIAVSVLVATLLAVFVWPTPYRYYRHRDNLNIREHRLTGEVEFLLPSGWKKSEK